MYLSRHACIVVSTCLYQRTDLHRSVFGHVQISINPSTRVIIYQNQCSCNPHRVREVFENCLDLPVLTCTYLYRCRYILRPDHHHRVPSHRYDRLHPQHPPQGPQGSPRLTDHPKNILWRVR